jgi:TPP-dependent pyruvate/acetoin dehydrogenase alpha subunit
LRQRLIDVGILTEAQDRQINAEVAAEVEAAVKVAEASPPPNETWLAETSVYAKPIAARY